MMRPMEVPCRVLAGRLVAAANVTTGEAEPQMHPARAGLQALLTTLWSSCFDAANLAQMRAVRGHALAMIRL